MHSASGNPNLCPKAKFTTIAKLRGRIPHRHRGVGRCEKLRRHFAVLGHDRVRVAAAMRGHVGQCRIQPIHHPHRQHAIQPLCVEIFGPRRALSLAHRLDPGRQLDPARYPPDVVAAWKRAVDSKPELVTLEVKGTGRVWIDFVERGPAPGVFKDLEVGDHVITVTGFDRKTWGKPQSLTASTMIQVSEQPADGHQKVARARLALSRAQASGDDVTRAGAMKQLAALLGVGDAVMISKRPDGAIQWETWRDRAPGFSPPKQFTNQKPEEMLEGLAGPRRLPPRRLEPPPFTKPPIVVEKAWYEQRWVQAAAAGTVLAVIVGGILIANRTQWMNFGGDIKIAN